MLRFGSNGSYQLGLGHDEDMDVPKRAQDLDLHSHIVACGGNHTLVIDREGCLFGAGSNEQGQLGSPVLGPSVHNFTRIDTDGLIWSLACCGWANSVLVSRERDQVYTCGQGTKGELGLGMGITAAGEPMQVGQFPPEGTKVVQVASSLAHTAVLLDNGQVWGWGVARKGQLGAQDDKVAWSPVLAYDPIGHSNAKAVTIGCGREFTAIGCDNGDIIVLGGEKAGINKVPKIDNFKQIECGWSAVHVLTKDGSVISWGNNSHGQLAQSKLQGTHISSIGAGTEHVVALTDSGSVLCWGWGEHGNCGPNYTDGQINQLNIKGTRVFGGYATTWVFTDDWPILS
uniref:ARAD1D25146p n=1 Tax=Blastobotrys adeninivorans TaxID=409370 RepID=A0A060TGQ4_BLAAD